VGPLERAEMPGPTDSVNSAALFPDSYLLAFHARYRRSRSFSLVNY